MATDPDKQLEALRADFTASNYELLRRLGQGGMGSVWEARHRELDIPVVIKVVHQELAKRPDMIERFRREGRVVAALGHPNVVRVTDFGVTNAGVLFLVMERLSGRSLREELDARGPIPVREAVGYILQALRGLGAAHRKQIVHRDIKLDNLFLCEPDDQGIRQVKVLDFGIAKVLSEVDAQHRTAEGMMVGTPQSAPPEQILGQRVDARSDVYAAGVALFRLIAARLPFIVPPGLAGDEAYMEMARMQVQEPAPRLSEVAKQLIDPDLELAVAKSLEKLPDERFQSAEVFASELERILRGIDPAHDAALARTEPLPRKVGGITRGELSSQAQQAPQPGAPVLTPNDVCGGFVIDELVARGGSADVYRAHNEITKKIVALKVLPASASEEQRQRTESEARALAEVKHPNIVEVYSASRGGHPNVSLHIQMELLDGKTLRQVMQWSGALPITEALTHAIEIAEATEALHGLGIFHRDIKPENVVVTKPRDGRPRTLKLLDLGAAKIAKYGQRTTGNLHAFGTSAYMSPEHLMGKPITAASDVYSLGHMLYEMIAGVNALSKDNPSPEELARRQIGMVPERLSAFVPGIAAKTSEAIARALEKDPLRRFETMAALAIALREALRDELAAQAAEVTRGIPQALVAQTPTAPSKPAQVPVQRGKFGTDLMVPTVPRDAFTPKPAPAVTAMGRTTSPMPPRIAPSHAGSQQADLERGLKLDRRPSSSRGPTIFIAGSLLVVAVAVAAVLGIRHASTGSEAALPAPAPTAASAAAEGSASADAPRETSTAPTEAIPPEAASAAPVSEASATPSGSPAANPSGGAPVGSASASSGQKPAAPARPKPSATKQYYHPQTL